MTATDNQIDLRGQWHIELDPNDIGIDNEWYNRELEEQINLPGTTDEAKLGSETTERETGHLSRKYEHIGPAWYQRAVTIPDSWQNSCIELFLERTRESTLWIDGNKIGREKSLTTPHRYDLTNKLSPGEHTITLRIDNSAEYIMSTGVQMSHMASEHTQTNWNGILGRIHLERTPATYVDDLFVTTSELDSGSWEIDIRTDIRNTTEAPQSCSLSLSAYTNGDLLEEADILDESFEIPPDDSILKTYTVTVSDPDTWDEFDPTVYELEATLETKEEGSIHVECTSFGFRDFTIEGTQFAINGQQIFLRGKCDCCVFPETGYAPMTVDEWRDVFETALRYGINHYRYHSWCPPEAAFCAADELGIYLQPELPHWNPVDALEDDRMFEFYKRELEQILDRYGNHPSFVLFTLGNELDGNRERMAELVNHCRKYDGRHQYAQGSNNHFTDPGLAKDDNFWITYETDEPADGNTGIRASFPSYKNGHINNEEPSTDHDYNDAVNAYDVPLISHEIGQYQAYPDYDEINDYTGVLEPRNLEVFQDHLEAHGMGELDTSFHRASGQLQVTCYREDIEAALRTDGFAGFQLLDLQDFPGQGTALVGVLDAHMNDKGFIQSERWREFCAPTVLLARMNDRTWTVGEEFSADLQIAHYGREPIENKVLSWELRDSSDRIIASDEQSISADPGGLYDIATIEASLDVTGPPMTCSLILTLEGTDRRNEYNIWVFPDTEIPEPETATVTRDVDEAITGLENGNNVLFLPTLDDLRLSVTGTFQSDFWNYSHFKDRGNPGTMGLLVDNDHPAIGDFPTESHSDWQWQRLLNHSRPVMLDIMPDSLEVVPTEYRGSMQNGYQPIIQCIDTPCENRKLGTLFEASIADGNLLVCTHDLPNLLDVPEARLLYANLVTYVDSPEFDPIEEVEPGILEKIVR